MTRVLKYIQCIIVLPIIMSIDKYRNIKLYVDASLVVHKDMMIHTGAFITMIIGRSRV